MKAAWIIGTLWLAAICTTAAGAEPKPAQPPAALPAGKSGAAADQTPVLNQVAGLLDQNRTDEAAALLETLPQAGSASVPLKDYLCARLAFARGQYTETLNALARAQMAGRPGDEWLPAAIFLEGMVYKKTGPATAAASAAEELKRGWPDSEWSRRAAELN